MAQPHSEAMANSEVEVEVEVEVNVGVKVRLGAARSYLRRPQSQLCLPGVETSVPASVNLWASSQAHPEPGNKHTHRHTHTHTRKCVNTTRDHTAMTAITPTRT